MAMNERVIGGRYELRAPIGEGGMATIHRAWDAQLEREVAVKLLRPQFGADAGFAARFRAEARNAGSLAHPNIVNVYDYGTDDDTQFIVMQLVEGRDLASYLGERRRLPVAVAVPIAEQVASALAAAHKRGIVHRDVKPGNILITDDGGARVADFGIARAVSEASMTVTGTTLGSVHYFSPEQARGDEVTGASDIYSLGIVLYEMLVGRRPFEGDSAAGVALRRLTDDPPPPSVYDRSLPPALVAIVMRALERDPARRFSSAEAFAKALRDFARDPAGAVLPPPPAPPRTPERTVYTPPAVQRPAPRPVAPRGALREERRGQPWWVWLLVLLALAMLAAIGFLGGQLLGGLAEETPSPTQQVRLVTVPDWEGDPLPAVELEAANLGLDLQVTREFDPTVERDRVISQDPRPGERREEGSAVRLVVSNGVESVSVPRVRGQTLEQATATLIDRGLRLGSVLREPSPEPAGTVLRSAPSEGAEVPRGEQIDLFVSSGPTPTPVPTPTPTPTPEPTPEPTPTPVEPTASPAP